MPDRTIGVNDYLKTEVKEIEVVSGSDMNSASTSVARNSLVNGRILTGHGNGHGDDHSHGGDAHGDDHSHGGHDVQDDEHDD